MREASAAGFPAHWYGNAVAVLPAWRRWLFGSGSLTARLEAHCQQLLRVAPLAQGRAPVAFDERSLLGVSTRIAWVREVALIADNVAVVFARSVLVASARAAWPLFFRVGTRPLGALLFDDPAVSRGPIEAARIDSRHTLWRRAAHHALLRSGEERAALWARRSCFWRFGKPLLVQELFLPGIATLDPGLHQAGAWPSHRAVNPVE